MPYCNLGEEGIVTYSFADGKSMTYDSKQAPIDVNVTQLPNNYLPGECSSMYTIWVRIKLYSTAWETRIESFGIQCWGPIYITDVGAIIDIERPGSTLYRLLTLSRGYTSIWNQIAPKPLGYYFYNLISYELNPPNFGIADINITIERTDGNFDWCGNGNPKCKIEVFSKSGILLHSNVGDCPCNFSVKCDRCPPETCCECDCGDVICCYGGDGIPLKIIRK